MALDGPPLAETGDGRRVVAELGEDRVRVLPEQRRRAPDRPRRPLEAERDARLAEHPEGVLPRGTPCNEIIGKCEDFIEATGSIGDVYLMHPFMLHTRSVNASARARFIINPPVKLKEPMCFARPNAADHSPVERAVLRALGKHSYDFVPTHPRQAIVPERLRIEKAIWDERARQAGVVVPS